MEWDILYIIGYDVAVALKIVENSSHDGWKLTNETTKKTTQKLVLF